MPLDIVSNAYKLLAQDGAARRGELHTNHGVIRTPAFMPIATHAAVKACHPSEVHASGADVLLCNNYHMMLRPGIDPVERFGGLHRFMGWDGPILTDSGGYQLVSLDSIADIRDDSVTFVSPYDGTRIRVTPEEVIAAQTCLGADIIMCLDHPVVYGASVEQAEQATSRTHRWAQRCRAVHPDHGQLLFGIVQGGFDVAAREQSSDVIAGLDFDGVAIGGLVLGEPLDVMNRMARASLRSVSEDKPRYLMGLGTDAELLAMIALGVDMFDCVVPTRLARNGVALTRGGRLSLRHSAYRDDEHPIEENCACPACSQFSRAYLRHLLMVGEILAHRLLSLHNLWHLGRLMGGAREAIGHGRFSAYQFDTLAQLRGMPDAGGGAMPIAGC